MIDYFSLHAEAFQLMNVLFRYSLNPVVVDPESFFL